MTDTKMNGNGNGQAPIENMEQAEEALKALRGAAMAGDILAKMKLGFILLSAPRGPFDLFEGAAVIVSAANDGNGRAAYRTAVLSAGAIAMARSWPTALVYLQRAAELGDETARQELAALTTEKELAARALSGEETATDAWSRLRRAVDIKAHMRAPSPKTLDVTPRIAKIENFLSPELCDALVETARGHLEPLTGPDGEKMPLEVAASHRTAISELSLQSILLSDRISEVVGLQNGGVEPPMILRYGGGQEYPAHFDFLDTSDPARAENVKQEGQRILTFLVFLNDDYEGGETDFPNIEKQFTGKKGDALFWWNIKQDGTPEPAARNGNCAVTHGEKWVLTQWMRGALQRPN